MNFEGNPFFWGFNEQRAIETLAKRAQATYNEPREVVEQKTALENYFEQNFGHSPNPAFITGATAIEPMPYIAPTSSTESADEEETEDTEETTGSEDLKVETDEGVEGDEGE